MSSKLWLLMPCLAVATAGFLAFSPTDMSRTGAAVAAAPCVNVASAEGTDVMSDATPDACVYAVQAADNPACTQRSAVVAVTIATAKAAAIPAVRFRRSADTAPEALEWPVDFVVLTARAAGGVFHATLGLIGDAYDFAEHKAEQLWI